MNSLQRSSVAVAAAVAAVALMAPLVGAAPPGPGYKPDYPQYCLNEQEDPPANMSDPFGTGSYHCTGAIWTKCNGIQYSTPCKICAQYDYTYGPPEGPSQPRKPSVGKHEYSNCVRLPGISPNDCGGCLLAPAYVDPDALGPTYSEVVEG